MRLRDIQKLIDLALPELKVVSGAAPAGNAHITNIPNLRRALLILKGVPGLGQLSDGLLAHPYMNASGNFNAPQGEANAFAILVTQYAHIVGGLKATLDAVLPPEEPLTANLRLPHFSSVKALADCVEDFARVFQVVGEIAPVPTGIQPAAAESFRVQGFDAGSEWLLLAAAAEYVLSFMARFWAKAVQIASFQHYRNAVRQQSALLNIAAEHVAAGEKHFEALLSAMCDQAVRDLRGEAPALEPESHQRAVEVLKLSADAIERGARLTLAAGAPPEALKNLPALDAQERLVASPSVAALPAQTKPTED